MSFFSRLKNIVRSNLNFDRNKIIDIENLNMGYDDIANNGDVIDEIPPDYTIEKEYYSILELEYGADFTKIKNAYKNLLKKYHPDMYQNKPDKIKIAQKLTKKINEAYNYFSKKYKE